ncbi:MAG: MoaD/ThiS family protein [Bacteroidetes bacterium]|nr:MoaD/ThiS family protein [Bacteroidota bacterium]MBS1978604.1 MoaD/ThiS family protein [Bacteroidota bacterium]
MKIKIVAFGIAKDILHQKGMTIDLAESKTLGALRELLYDQFPEFEKLKSLKFAVGDEYRTDDFHLREGDEVAIIPPVSGG